MNKIKQDCIIIAIVIIIIIIIIVIITLSSSLSLLLSFVRYELARVKKLIPEKGNSDSLDEILDTSLTCAHPTHHLAIMLDVFFSHFFFHNLTKD